MLSDLSVSQFQLISSAINLTTALMGAAAVLLLALRSHIAPAYQSAVTIMGVVVAMAAFHYLRIFDSWRGAFRLDNEVFVATGLPFNSAYRSADWLGTVPLILSALVLVLDLGKFKGRSLVARLAISAVAMIALGLIGDHTGTDMSARALWGALSMLPFFYILFVLWVELAKALSIETPTVRAWFSGLRWLLLGSWSVYPVIYALPLFGIAGSNATVAVQLGYSLADIVAKVAFGLMIYAIAREKTDDLTRRLLPASAQTGR